MMTKSNNHEESGYQNCEMSETHEEINQCQCGPQYKEAEWLSFYNLCVSPYQANGPYQNAGDNPVKRAEEGGP